MYSITAVYVLNAEKREEIFIENKKKNEKNSEAISKVVAAKNRK